MTLLANANRYLGRKRPAVKSAQQIPYDSAEKLCKRGELVFDANAS